MNEIKKRKCWKDSRGPDLNGPWKFLRYWEVGKLCTKGRRLEMSFASATQERAWWVGWRKGLEPETSQWNKEAVPSTALMNVRDSWSHFRWNWEKEKTLSQFIPWGMEWDLQSQKNNLFSLREGSKGDFSCGLIQPCRHHLFIWLAQTVYIQRQQAGDNLIWAKAPNERGWRPFWMQMANDVTESLLGDKK